MRKLTPEEWDADEQKIRDMGLDPVTLAAALKMNRRARDHAEALARAEAQNLELAKAMAQSLDRGMDAYRKLSDAQRAKAKKPRGKGDDDRTMRELVADVAKIHPELKPSELLPFVHSAADANGMKPISLKRLSTVLRELSQK